MFFVLSRAWDKKQILSLHEESNLRPSDSALRCSTTEPQRLYGERGLLRSSYAMSYAGNGPIRARKKVFVTCVIYTNYLNTNTNVYK